MSLQRAVRTGGVCMPSFGRGTARDAGFTRFRGWGLEGRPCKLAALPLRTASSMAAPDKLQEAIEDQRAGRLYAAAAKLESLGGFHPEAAVFERLGFVRHS